ncbi:hypothetical protein GCM10025876_22120 [Demequina litorisediminis]|uniref:Uncharacterized protein n=1 Tax=Demequina litorisediminis TaxID=1849022 RepID=A0ABQ6IDR5_9MICO|nr:hypothetical protein GCM10025876_22120 [Demequina litorisediminis]
MSLDRELECAEDQCDGGGGKRNPGDAQVDEGTGDGADDAVEATRRGDATAGPRADDRDARAHHPVGTGGVDREHGDRGARKRHDRDARQHLAGGAVEARAGEDLAERAGSAAVRSPQQRCEGHQVSKRAPARHGRHHGRGAHVRDAVDRCRHVRREPVDEGDEE